MQHKNAEYFDVLRKFIEDYWDKYGVSPTTRAIADGTNLSNATVGRYLQYMRQHGMIDYQGHRCYKTRKQILGESGQCSVPVLGRIACGIPKFAAENIEECIKLPVSLVGGRIFLSAPCGRRIHDRSRN